MFLYYITDRRQLSADRDESVRLLLERIRLATAAEVHAIQLREKDLSARELVELGTLAATIVREANPIDRLTRHTRLLINSRVDVAIACGADGVHLRSDDISASEARAIFMRAGANQALIGVSCHSVREIESAEAHGADFGVFGPVFGKAGGQATGVGDLEVACRHRRAAQPAMPVLALGGVALSNAQQCIKAGAAGIAGIRMFQEGDISETVSQLRKAASTS